MCTRWLHSAHFDCGTNCILHVLSRVDIISVQDDERKFLMLSNNLTRCGIDMLSTSNEEWH